MHSVLCRDSARQPAAVLIAFLNSSMVARIHGIYSLNGNKKPKKGQKVSRSPCTEEGTITIRNTGHSRKISCKNTRGWLALPHGVRVPIGADIILKDIHVDQSSVSTTLGL